MSETSPTQTNDAPMPGAIADSARADSPADASAQSITPPPGAAPAPDATTAPETESRRARLSRRAHRVRLYMYAFVGVALLVYVVALAASNTHRVRVNWVFGSSSVSLIWLVTLAAILGWLLGLLVAGVFRWRTRAPRAS